MLIRNSLKNIVSGTFFLQNIKNVKSLNKIQTLIGYLMIFFIRMEYCEESPLEDLKAQIRPPIIVGPSKIKSKK